MTIEATRMPAQVRALNAGYQGARKIGRTPLRLRKYQLMDRASRKAGGLTDFGDPRFEAGLDQLIASIEDEDRLNGLGRVIASGHITNLLTQRLLITAHLAAHPEIHDERIERPIFIIGGPRTGTTISHHLMSQDQQFRFPYTWESKELHPPLKPTTMETDGRVARAQKNLDRMLKLAPDLDAAHPVGAREAEECAVLHAYDFHSSTFMAMFNCQGYDRWLVEQDVTWVYEQQKLMLKYMQSGGLRPSECWLLKTPPHMENIDRILVVFPDARFVTTYREPTELTASFCSLLRSLIQVVEDKPDWHDHGRYVTWRVGHMLDRNVELRRRYADRTNQFIDFPMHRMVRDPLTCVAEIYKHFELDLNDQARARMQTFMDARSMATRKPHVYDPADYGIDMAALWPRFQQYRDFYCIDEELPA